VERGGDDDRGGESVAVATALAYQRREITEEEIKEVVSAFLQVDSRHLDPSRSFASYGLDSLSAMQLVARLEDATGRQLPEWLIAEHPTLAALVEALGDHESATSEIALMRADGHLPSDIRPAEGGVTDRPRHVLLTGATGFLGAFLVRSLLEESPARITCLVRSPAGEGKRRLHESLTRYGVWSDAADSRIDVVEGDLTSDRLGLQADTYQLLARSIDAIYHAGADVNWVSSYSALRATNVVGTRELLRLACAFRSKPFHFISSLSVCYPVDGPRWIDEACDLSACLESLPLGYAQSKCVGEALVHEAGRRGLPVRIYRPALLAGDTVIGRSNLDDLIARLLKGCIEMGAAPDLDWAFDALPVDYAARAIVKMSHVTASRRETVHLIHSRPRHWRECVLWANFFGYRMTLEPFADWRQRLARDSSSPGHPFHGLRAFFLRRVGDRTVAEHYEQRRRSQVSAAATRELLRAVDAADPPRLDAELLDRYVEDYIGRGFLPERARRRPHIDMVPTVTDLEPLLRRHFADETLEVRSMRAVGSGSEQSILGELVSWRHGRGIGVVHYDVEVAGASPSTLALTVKTKAPDEAAIAAAETTAEMCDRRLGQLVKQFRDCLGLRHGHERELALYTTANEGLGAYMPACYGTWRRSDGCGLLLERLRDMEVMDASDSTARWTREHIATAIDGLAGIHSVWIGRANALAAQPWIGHVWTTAAMQRTADLWRALADHAAPRCLDAGGAALVRRHRRLADTVEEWWPALERGPQTLLHYDFNSRNVGIRRTAAGPRLVAYDWELATIGAPQRDLAEFLCFVLPPSIASPTSAEWVEHHRLRLEQISGRHLSARQWRAGFGSALADVLVNRLAFYALIDRVSAQPFLTRVLRTWNRLFDGFEK
jgi:thioester reductase-like protein